MLYSLIRRAKIKIESWKGISVKYKIPIFVTKILVERLGRGKWSMCSDFG